MRIVGRNRGQARSSDEIDLEVVGEVSEEELADLELDRPANTGPPTVQRLRDTHHGLARAIAACHTLVEAGRIAGYTQTRVYTLMQDPAFQELVASYRAMADEAHAQLMAPAMEDGIAILTSSTRMIRDKLEIADETGELPGYGELGRLAQVFGEFTGLSAAKRTVNTNVNANLGDLLASARARAFPAPHLKLVAPSEEGVDRSSEGLGTQPGQGLPARSSEGLPPSPSSANLPEASPVSPPTLAPGSKDK